MLTDAQVQRFRADGLLLIPESVYGPVREDLGRLIDAAKDGPVPDYTYMYYSSPNSADRSWLYRINELIGEHQLDSVKLMFAYPAPAHRGVAGGRARALRGFGGGAGIQAAQLGSAGGGGTRTA